jgi:hypothetical protein
VTEKKKHAENYTGKHNIRAKAERTWYKAVCGGRGKVKDMC